jgi:hypothetical protein
MPNSPRFIQLLREIEVLHNKKNAGYAGADETDPFKNFKFSSILGVSPFKGCLVRMSDKFIRVANLTRCPASEQVGENIKDTLMDLAVYALIAICLYEDQCASGEIPEGEN